MEINKYHNSKIYKLVSDNTDKIYIGSTVQPLHKRKSAHKSDKKLNRKNSTTSFELFQLGDVDIILIENFKCENKEELHSKERYYIELNKEICVNKIIPTRTKKEWTKDNLEKVQEYQKEWKENNKEYVKEQSKEYYNNNIEKIQEYKLNNQEIINKKKKEQFNCECGGNFTKTNKSRHLNSKNHLKYINGKLNQVL